jgi:uncharacterized membrane protein
MTNGCSGAYLNLSKRNKYAANFYVFMLWLVFALMSALFNGANSVIHRVVMLKEDALSYAFVIQILTAFLYVPFLLAEFVFPFQFFPWFLVLAASSLWTLIAYIGFEAHKRTEVSLRKPLGEFRIIFLLIFFTYFA